jgi:GAF domain-containing protein
LAKPWPEGQQEAVANVFLAEARACYARWGAAAKVEVLDRRYADLPGRRLRYPSEGLADDSVAASQALTEADAGALDLFSVMKAAQAIAGEMELERLLSKLMRIVIENAGAERGSLILERDGESFLRAEGSLDPAEVRLRDDIPLEEAQSLPLSIVNYVRRTSESVVLAEAMNDDRYSSDPYVRRNKPRSVMCVPALNQGRLIGALYLENNMAGGAFTPDRVRVCQMLVSEAAISLENARLYTETKSAEETLRSIMEGTAAVIGGDFFASMVRHLARALQVRYAFVTECRERKKTSARTLAFWMGDRLADNGAYEIAETPCLKVLAGETCYYPQGVQKLFPNDKDLVEMGAEGYLGIPLCNASGEVIGHLAVLDDKPMIETPQGRSLLNIFAARAGAELERLHAEEELRLAMAEQEGEFEPVGSSKTVKVDVRIIAATNRNLEDEVRAGRFRPDLFYRLNVLPLRVPPLRDRVEDIPQLAMFFLSRFSRQFGRAVDGIAQETIELMMNYDWPGNIRELQNLIERGVVLSNGSILSIDRSLLLPSHTSQTGQIGQTAHPVPESRPRAAAQAAMRPAPPPSGAEAPSTSSASL